MKKKITVNILNEDYNMVAEENEEYVRRVAAFVDTQLREVVAGGRISQAAGGVLTAMNITDRLFQEQETSENLRRQVKENIEEAARLKLELSEARREIFKLQNKK